MKKQIVYYTDSRLEKELDEAVRKQILKAAYGIPIISVSQKPLDFGGNICVGFKPRCYLSLYEQLLRGLEAAPEDAIVYLCEHDVFYHSGHFDYIPPRNDNIYYNLNRYYAMRNKDHYLRAVGKRALSQAVAHREVLIEHAAGQVKNRTMNVPSPCVGPFLNFHSEYPNVDMRHGGNLTDFCAFDNPIKDPRLFDKIDYWGTPNEFKARVGLEDKAINTADYLHETFPAVGAFNRTGLAKMFKALGFKKGAEIGVKMGLFSKVLCEENPDLSLKSIDPWTMTPKIGWDAQEKTFGLAIKNLSPFNVEIIKKTSMQAAAEDVPKWSLDFVYIDADHSFNAVMQDIIVWSDRVRPGGIVSGHDYDSIDVKTAIDAYVKIHGYELFTTVSQRKARPMIEVNGDKPVYPSKMIELDLAPSWFFAKPGQGK